MDLLKKVELLLNATTRSMLPHRQRHTILDEQEEQLLTEIRQAVGKVQAQERLLADRLKTEQTQADDAAQRGDWDQQRTHERRAEELERQLEQESIQAINLEEKLAALEEKLALAREAVEKEAQKAAAQEAEADRILGESQAKIDPTTAAEPKSVPADRLPAPKKAANDSDLTARKSRLSD